MFGNELYSDINLKKLNKYLCKTERLFLNRLCFWSSHRKSYGIEKDGRVWIYNTLEDWSNQLNISKSSIRRAIKSLKDKRIIDSDYLSHNKRNRTLYYSINFDEINEYLSSFKKSSCVHICDLQPQKNVVSKESSEHIGEHMYIMDNSKQNFNKSYKSINKNLVQKNPEQIIQEKPCLDLKKDDIEKKTIENIIIDGNNISTPPQKPTIIQDMLKIWNDEFSGSKIELSKNLARFLVATFKTKFKSCLKEWRRYLKTLKTSVYLMSEKFKLSIWWVIKFMTIDRIRAGELGAKPDSVVADSEDLMEKAKHHIDEVQESEKCKDFRKKIMKIMNPSIYTEARKIDELLAKLNQGDTVIVYELSRLCRSMHEMLNIVNEIVDVKKVRLTSVTQDIDINPNDKKDIKNTILVWIFSLLADLERTLISQRTKDALKARVAKGIKLGKPVGTIQESIYDKDEEIIFNIRLIT